MTRPIKWNLIAQQYDQMVKYATALRLGTAESESILRRFTRGGPIHIAEWDDSPEHVSLPDLAQHLTTSDAVTPTRQRHPQHLVADHPEHVLTSVRKGIAK